MSIEIYLEVGKKKVIAGALAWPGWCRSARDEAAALQALLDYGPRYAKVLRPARLGFQAPTAPEALVVVERLPGNATTDFGAPELAPAVDEQPIDASELKRLQAVLKACWQALDAAAEAATGKTLRLGPRGGGRDLDRMLHHLLESDTSYLARLAWKHKLDPKAKLQTELPRLRQAMTEALTAAAQGELPTTGPRGGKLWRPRYFVRRTAWHTLDHVWEIEDRVVEE